MLFSIITLFPEVFTALQQGITGRAINNKLIHIDCYNPRDYSNNDYQQVDDRPYGGGPGMVMQYQPLASAIQAAKNKQPAAPVVYLSPQGKRLEQTHIRQLANDNQPLILLCGRYAGIDERLIENAVDVEYSIGDYILSGGELPVMVLIDAITRLLPGAVGNQESVNQESFSRQHLLLDYPHYTRPQTIAGKSVPKVLLSGDHDAIQAWRIKKMWARTWQKRQDLVKREVLTVHEQQLLDEGLAEDN